ncbi:galactokinase-like [Teleopsis dalmanni]|uniref:galactokinase-like n=1 Tax=Teleopsis dalmanni TaxID=139649 RepID=UPI0018CD497B|nr:galactokinase-like [Teleopsis dalmanni]
MMLKALPMVTLIVGSRCPGDEADIITCSASCEENKETARAKFSLTNMEPGKTKWANYIKGVIHYYSNKVQGFKAVIVSNVPIGSGLSSSASLEVATLTFLEHLTGRKVESNAKRALICQAAEHNYVEMPCGIMDQTISVCGQKNHALLLDCRSLETYQIPFVASEKDLVVLICNSGVRHELSKSEYPKRRAQCMQALELMALKSYRDATESSLSGN